MSIKLGVRLTTATELQTQSYSQKCQHAFYIQFFVLAQRGLV